MRDAIAIFLIGFAGTAISFIGTLLAHFLCITPKAIWEESQNHIKSLNEKIGQYEASLSPKLRVWYDGNSQACRITHNQGSQIQEAYRICVETTGASPVDGCKGVLTEIKFEGDAKPIWGGNIYNLAFSPHDDDFSANKTVYQNTPETLDVLFLQFENSRLCNVKMGTKKHEWPQHFTHPRDMFNREGNYFLKINIISKTPPTLTFLMKFTISKNVGQTKAELTPLSPIPDKSASQHEPAPPASS